MVSDESTHKMNGGIKSFLEVKTILKGNVQTIKFFLPHTHGETLKKLAYNPGSKIDPNKDTRSALWLHKINPKDTHEIGNKFFVV